jgi:hypothetical protein
LGLAAAGLFLVAMTGCGSDSDDAPGGSGGATGGTGGATGGTGGATGGTGGATGGTGGTGGATGGTGGATGGTGGATGDTGGATGGTGGATGGTGGGGDDDNDCDHATDLSSTGTGTGAIDPVDEADFYSFPFAAGDWVIVRATVDESSLPVGETLDDQPYEDVLDTAVTIYDEAGTQVATMDDAYPRFTTNSELIWRVPADGTYCIKVEDWASWAGESRDPAATGAYFDYEIGLYTPSETIDAEPNNDETEPQAQTYTELTDDQDQGIGIFYSANYGTLDTDADVDVYQFTMPAGTVQLSTEDFTTPIGPGDAGVNGNGSTLELGMVSISDTAGSIIAQLDGSKGSNQMSVPLEAGTDYLMWVTRNAGTTVGANDFYNLVNYAWDEDNPREVETTTGANDTAATAEAITLTTSTTNLQMDSGYVLGFIDGAGTDVDYFSFTAEAGDTVSLGCGALRGGSGLVGATFAVNDSADTEMQTETETDTEDIYWSDTTYGFETMPAVAITTAGTYYFVVSAASQNPNVSSNFYRCGIHVETP